MKAQQVRHWLYLGTCVAVATSMVLILSTLDARGKLIGYFMFGCFGEEGERFNSVEELMAADDAYLSYRDADGQCVNVEITLETVDKILRGIDEWINDIATPSPASSQFGRITAEVWNSYFAKVRECWNAKAKESGLTLYNQEDNPHSLELYDPTKHHNVPANEISHAGGFYSATTNTIYIKPATILNASIGMTGKPKNFYDSLVYVMIHEAVHAKRTKDSEREDNPEVEEREVQKIAYDFYKKIFGKEPPYSYNDLSDEEIHELEVQRETLNKERRALSKCMEDPPLAGCGFPPSRLYQIDMLLKEINRQLIYIPENKNYDPKKHKLEPCA